MSRRLLAALLALALGPFPAAAGPSGATGTVVGWVRDSLSGRAVPNASVGLQGSYVGTFADTSGWFRLAGVPVGERVIVAAALGFRQGQARVRVRPGLRDTVRLRLRARPFGILEMDTIPGHPRIPQNR